MERKSAPRRERDLRMSEVLDTARWVAERSQHVWIDEEALLRFCRALLRSPFEIPPWDRQHHFQGGEEETAVYILLLDTLNFCFWPAKGAERWEISYGKETLSGYIGLAACLKKAIESGVPLERADYLARLSMEALGQVLSGKGELLLMERRLEAVRELGEMLCRHYAGKAAVLVNAADKSALKLSELLAARLLSFRDTAEYEGRKIVFLKRAQIVCADLYGAFEGKGCGAFTDLAELTAFADYKLPQVLRQLGILHYSTSLARRVDGYVLIEAGSPEEVEIRANTVWAVELLRQKLKRGGRPLSAFELDGMLWNMGQHDAYRTKPYHRTVTIFY